MNSGRPVLRPHRFAATRCVRSVSPLVNPPTGCVKSECRTRVRGRGRRPQLPEPRNARRTSKKKKKKKNLKIRKFFPTVPANSAKRGGPKACHAEKAGPVACVMLVISPGGGGRERQKTKKKHPPKEQDGADRRFPRTEPVSRQSRQRTAACWRAIRPPDPHRRRRARQTRLGPEAGDSRIEPKADKAPRSRAAPLKRQRSIRRIHPACWPMIEWGPETSPPRITYAHYMFGKKHKIQETVPATRRGYAQPSRQAGRGCLHNSFPFCGTVDADGKEKNQSASGTQRPARPFFFPQPRRKSRPPQSRSPSDVTGFLGGKIVNAARTDEIEVGPRSFDDQESKARGVRGRRRKEPSPNATEAAAVENPSAKGQAPASVGPRARNGPRSAPPCDRGIAAVGPRRFGNRNQSGPGIGCSR